MNEIKKLSELAENQVDQAIDVLIEGFYFTLSSVTKDRDKLHKLFKPSLDYDMTYAYLLDGNAVGFLGLADNQKRPIHFEKEFFSQTIGGLTGKTAYKAVCTAFETVKEIGPQDILIDYLATNPECRSQGIGTQMITFIRDTLGYKQIQLETYLTNTRAIALYERLGFQTIKVEKTFAMKISGYGGFVTMRYDEK